MPSDASKNPSPLHPILQQAMHDATTHGQTVIARIPAARPARDPWDLAARALSMGDRATVWSDPDQKYLAVGVDEAYRLTGEGEARLLNLDAAFKTVRSATHPLLSALPLWFGGFSFDHRPSPTARWNAWPAAELVTHSITAIQHDRKNYLVLSIAVTPSAREDDLHSAYDALKARVAEIFEPSTGAVKSTATFSTVLSQNTWESQVAKAQASIDAGIIRKIVLARCVQAPWINTDTDTEAGTQADTPQANTQTDAQADHARNGAHLATVLQDLRTRYRHCTIFALLRSDGERTSTFLGATPELLIERRDAKIYTMALAGTTPRAEGFKADEAQRQGLLASEKERTEHHFVVKDIDENLRDIGIDVHVPSAPDVVSYPNVHHLRTTIRSKETTEKGLLPIANALHPTPAICGTPTDTTYAWLHEHEGMDRGWYSGGVMWLNDEGDGRVNVALRCAIADNSGVYAYAGAGIVEGSDATLEWEETTAKLSPMCDAFEPPLGKDR